MKAAIKDLDYSEQLKVAWHRIELLVNVRERSCKELADRLAQLGFMQKAIDTQVAQAVDIGWVDDSRFTEMYISGKKRSGWGRLRIEKNLRSFGIELSEFPGYPQYFFDPCDERARATKCLKKFSTRSKNVREATYRHLMSKGYTSTTIQAVISEYEF